MPQRPAAKLHRLVRGGNSEALLTFHHARERAGIIWTLAIQGTADTLLQVRQIMKCIILTIVFALLAIVGCTKKEAASDEKHLKIVVEADGTIFADGTRCSLEELSRRLDVLKEKKGVVWYYRANPGGEPYPQAVATIKLVVDKQLSVAMFLKEDFSDRIRFK